MYCDRCGTKHQRPDKTLCKNCENTLHSKVKQHFREGKLTRLRTLHAVEKRRDSAVVIGNPGHLGMCDPVAAADYVRQTLEKRQEILNQHGAVKHWKRNAAGEMVQI